MGHVRLHFHLLPSSLIRRSPPPPPPPPNSPNPVIICRRSHLNIHRSLILRTELKIELRLPRPLRQQSPTKCHPSPGPGIKTTKAPLATKPETQQQKKKRRFFEAIGTSTLLLLLCFLLYFVEIGIAIVAGASAGSAATASASAP